MKKQVLLIAFVGALSTLSAQSFPNGGFENWTSQMNYEDPEYWTGMNILTVMGAEETAIKTTDVHSGTYALKLVNNISDIGNDGEIDTIPGILVLGTSDILSGTGTTGFPFTHRPDSLIGWYKLISPENTAFHLQFSCTRWDAGAGAQETIGAAYYEGEASANYIRFSVPIIYAENGLPDSIQAFIGNSVDGFVATNELYIDDLGFVYNTTAGMEEQHAQVQLFPNPVTTELHIQSDQPIEGFSVRDLQGKQLFEHTETIQSYALNTGHFKAGVYFCELHFSNGASERLKFVKQ